MSRNSSSPLGMIRAAVATLMLAALAACASPFNANVQRFSQALPAPQGQTFAIVAEDQALAGGLEFSQYAGLVANKLQGLGYSPAANANNADMIVRFDYGVDKGREKVVRTASRDPFWNPWYGYGPRSYYGRPGYYRGHRPIGAWGYGWYDPFFDSGYESYTVYISGVSLKIDRRADGQRLFEGRAEAASTSNRLQYLVPNLVEAMFTDFPGNSGETVRISVAPEKKTKR
jgi:hypothetical protein